MTREEAQALAESEILEYARQGRLAEAARLKGKPEFEYALGTLLGAFGGIGRDVRSGQLQSGDIASLAALCIELLRECHLRRYNTVRVEPNPS